MPRRDDKQRREVRRAGGRPSWGGQRTLGEGRKRGWDNVTRGFQEGAEERHEAYEEGGKGQECRASQEEAMEPGGWR